MPPNTLRDPRTEMYLSCLLVSGFLSRLTIFLNHMAIRREGDEGRRKKEIEGEK